MSDPAEQQLSFTQAPPAPIQWRSWPAREHALRTLLTVLGLLMAAVVIQWVAGRPYMTLLALAALVVAMWRFFLPVGFELSDEGVDQRLFGRRRRIPWQAIGAYEVCGAGVLLLPEKDDSALAAFRGLYVPWTTHRDEVLANVHHYLGGPDEG